MNKILKFINLHTGEEEKSKVIEYVKSNISFRGANLWILACAIVIASIGLNVNSTAVIIGAMLISPLMAPIVGAGFGLGMYDFYLLKKSLKNLLVATFVGLIVSSIYFYISPFKETQSEILARTSPNIYDILIAFFGGSVGVIAITRVEKGNPIPGVAIATALMPPLCTAGYGLAIGNYKFFFGAIYLYTINCVFICIATFLIVKFLKYPRVQLVDNKNKKMVTYTITSILLVVLLPSIYFAYTLFQEKSYNQRVSYFIENEFEDKGFTLLYKKTQYNSNPKKIELAFLSKKFSKNELKNVTNSLEKYGVKNTQLKIRQDTIDIKKDILNEISKEKSNGSKKDALILDLQKKLEQNQYENLDLLEEVKILFPEVENISITNHKFNETEIPVLIYISKTTINEDKLAKWLEKRLNKKKMQLFRLK